jgi:isovaleryl-CoA dehydrogenase
MDMWRKLGEAGFLGPTADEDYGGLAMGYQAHCVIMEELSRASGLFIFRPYFRREHN